MRTEYTPDVEECRIIIYQVIAQAIKDFEKYSNAKNEDDKYTYLTASSFLFDDEYFVDWGGEEINLDYMCYILDLNVDWLRNKIMEKFRIKANQHGVILPEKTF